MAGTKAGGLKASATTQKRFGKDFYRAIGRRGGQNGHSGGFANNPALARAAGAKGGRRSKRGPARKSNELTEKELEKLEKDARLDALLEKIDNRKNLGQS